MPWEILFGILVAAAAGGWTALVGVAKSLKVDFAKLDQQQRDALVVNHAFKTAVALAILDDKSYKAQQAVVQELLDRYDTEHAKLVAVVAKVNPFAVDCVNVGINGHITNKPDVTKVNAVTRTQAHRATVGDSVIGVGKGNGNNRFACDVWYTAPFRGVIAGWSLYVSSSDGMATAKRTIAERETEVYSFKAPLCEDGTVSARDCAAGILYAALVECGKTEVYWGQYGKPAPRARIDGENVGDYIQMCIDFPPGGGVNVARTWGLKDTVVPA